MTATILSGDPYDESLLAHVHPPGWQNPQPAPLYHLVVVGAGTAGLVAAAGAAGLGARVALVEKELMGGDCLNVGCVPSKAMLRSARAWADVRDAGAFGVQVPPGVSVDFPAVMARLRRLRAVLSSHDSVERFRGLGVDVFLGAARFGGPDAVHVAGRTLRFRRAVIATGARAATLPIPGLAEAGYLTNETVFALTELPRRLAVIGSGPVGCELAQAFARLGARVTLLERSAQILPREDADAAKVVERSLARDGVTVRSQCLAARVQVDGTDKILEFEGSSPGERLCVDAILLGVGRVPNIEGLDLDRAGVACAAHRVHVDDHLRTTNPRIYAAGDVCSAYQFTHAADAMARVVLQNALFRGRGRASALTIPRCTYTDPEVAHVGLSETLARERGVRVQTFVQPLSGVDRAVLDGETEGFVKIHVRPGSDRILGGTIVARHAGEMIGELALAMTAGLGLKMLARTIHPYPTQAEAIRKVADAHQRTRLTPFVRWLLARWLAWSR